MDRRLRTQAALAAIILVVTLAGVSASAADLPESFRQPATLSETRTDWVRTDGRHVAFGSGDRLLLAESGPPFADRFELTLDGPVSDALLAGRRLIVVVAGRRLGWIDLAWPDAGATFVTLEPSARR